MADYKGIKGFKVQYLSADPSDPIIGQTWYNSTSKDLKFTGPCTRFLGIRRTSMNTVARFTCRSRNTNCRFSFCGLVTTWLYSINRRI
jgi:hypothetical protein